MKRPNKNAVIRARCNEELKRQIEQVAVFQNLDSADIVRIACATYVQKFRTPFTQTEAAYG